MINPKNPYNELFSCSADTKVIHWLNTGNPFNHLDWKMQKVYTVGDCSVNCLNTLYISETEKYFITFSSNGSLDMFSYDNSISEYTKFHTIAFNKKLQDTICLTILNDKYLLLLSGGYDSSVNVYTVNRGSKEVQFKIALKGHLNDIRDISAICPQLDDTKSIQFVSSSQDTYIRLWHVSEMSSEDVKALTETLQQTNITVFDEYKSKTSYVFHTESEQYYNITLDSVLSGHEDSVSSVKWGYVDNELVLLSSSFDFTVGLWRYDNEYNIWNKDVTLGEMLGNKHSFYSALFVENYNSILAYTYNGAFYLWRYISK
jgi:WD40 repeat protein